MSNVELDAFEEYFFHDLEKWFSADIACCDHCYDDFLSMWPHADRADDQEFQTKGIDLKSFYSGSYLRDQYSEEEFWQQIGNISCPRCGSPLGRNIWAYNLPFDVRPNFERTIREIGSLARSTPFLLLEHEFCREVLGAIRAISGGVSPVQIAEPLFRARCTRPEGFGLEVASFDLPPAAIVQEGRYNHAGNPVLYLASDKETCQVELRNNACSILEFELTRKIKILDLIDPYAAHREYDDLLNSLVYSALVSATHLGTGFEKPHYIVSRFVADCARQAGFDAIKYPSTRRSGHNFNLVILNPTVTLASAAKVVGFHTLSAAA